MIGRRAGLVVVVVAAVLAGFSPPLLPPVTASNHYTLESNARYEIRPGRGLVAVRVALSFTNTTPDTGTQFSLFRDIQLAVQDEATQLTATDDGGQLDVRSGTRGSGRDRVRVATIVLREPLRHEESVDVELRYVLRDVDGDGSSVRVRPSLVIFPAWSFGTSGRVSVTVPNGYEMRVDGDPLEESGDQLVSGPIDDPNAWLAVVTAVGASDLALLERTVPLEGGTADVLVRAFADDPQWGERTLDVISEALPRIEEAIGLPYPVRGQLVVTETVAADRSGFGESPIGGTEIAISFEQPPFTVVHQMAHVWLPPTLIEARWIGEGLASVAAARVGEDLGIEPPFDPAAEAEANADAAFALDAWPASATPEQQAYGYAASWAFIDELEASVGADAIRTVLARVAGAVGPYESAEVEPDPAPSNGSEPIVPLSSRGFLDQLEMVTGSDLSAAFAERVLREEDVALLEARREARAAFEALLADAEPWGAPDPVRAAMAAWRFDEAMTGIAAAEEWLVDRDDLVERMVAAGLSTPDRLQQAYRAYGGGGEAEAELRTESAVVDAYAAAADRVNGERSFIERFGLLGGPDPGAQLVLANGRFGGGDLTGAVDAIEEAERVVASAEAGGIVRLVSLLLVVIIVAGLAIILFRRRASYTRGP